MDFQYSSYLKISKNELWISKNQIVLMDIHNSFLDSFMDTQKMIYGYPKFIWISLNELWISKNDYGYPKFIYGYP